MCSQLARNGYNVAVAAGFSNQRIKKIPLTVDRDDLSATLELLSQKMHQQASTNDSYIPTGGTAVPSSFNVTSGQAVIYFQGFPCTGTFHGFPIRQAKYEEVAAASDAMMNVLAGRNEWTRMNAGFLDIYLPDEQTSPLHITAGYMLMQDATAPKGTMFLDGITPETPPSENFIQCGESAQLA